jgi:hypothetical protein
MDLSDINRWLRSRSREEAAAVGNNEAKPVIMKVVSLY